MWSIWKRWVRPLDPYYAAGIALFWVSAALAAIVIIRH